MRNTCTERDKATELPLSASAEAAVCSTSAAFCWVTVSSCATASFTWPMPIDCSAVAWLIWRTRSLTRDTDDTTPAIVWPASAIWREPSATWDRGADQRTDFLGRPRTALRQRPHLASHHGKTPALLACACRFHGGIEGQQVGLKGNALDHRDNLAHLARRLFDGVHGLPHLLHGQAARPCHFGTLVAAPGHRTRCVGSLPHGAGQLLHRSGGFLQIGGLCLGATVKVMPALRNLLGGPQKPGNLVAHITHHGTQVDLDLLQATHQGRQRRCALRTVQRGDQVAAGNVARKPLDRAHAAHDAAVKPRQHACASHPHQCQLGTPGQDTLPAQPERQHSQQHDTQQHQRQRLRGRQLLQPLQRTAHSGVNHAAVVQTNRLALRGQITA